MTFNPDNPNEHAGADPMDAATNAQLTPLEFYGQIDLECWFCGLVKGAPGGKEPYDPQRHQRRNTAVDIIVTPLADAKLTFNQERHMIAESKEWIEIVWASLKACGATNVREVNGKWCRVSQVSTGRKYTDKNGETKESTTLKFLELYPDKAACRDAYWKARGGNDNGIEDIEDHPVAGAQPTPDADAKEIATARQFLHLMIKQHNYQFQAIAAWVSGVPLVAKHFGDPQVLTAEIQAVMEAA
jgi:hypothetical protein